MVDEEDRLYDLLTATIYAQAEFIKNIPATKENIKLLTKPNKFLPNNMSLIELTSNNVAGWLKITIERFEKKK